MEPRSGRSIALSMRYSSIFLSVLLSSAVLGPCLGCADSIDDGDVIDIDLPDTSVVDSDAPNDAGTDSRMEEPDPEIVEAGSSRICSRHLARGAVDDESFPRIEGKVRERQVYIDDFYDPESGTFQDDWRRLTTLLVPIGFTYVEPTGPIEWSSTASFARSRADSEDSSLVSQLFLRAGDGEAESYLSYFSILVNGRPTSATFLQRSLDGRETLKESNGGIQAVTSEPFVAFEVEVPAELLPDAYVADVQYVAGVRPLNDENWKTFSHPTSKWTFYNGGNAWPDVEMEFLCPPDEYLQVSDFEQEMIDIWDFEDAYLYLPGHTAREHYNPIPVEEEEVEMVFFAQRNQLHGQTNMAYQLLVNGIPQGDPIYFHESGQYYGQIGMRRKLTVELDPELPFNTVQMAVFVEMLEPVFTARGKKRGVSSSHIGGGNIVYLTHSGHQFGPRTGAAP